jgi:hypothetical protein
VRIGHCEQKTVWEGLKTLQLNQKRGMFKGASKESKVVNILSAIKNISPLP